jgi:hypothetical protein
MMKKKLLSACLLFAGLFAFSPTDASARPYHHHSVHRVHYSHVSHRARHYAHGYARRRFAYRHYGRRHAVGFARYGRGRVAYGGGGRPSAWCGWWLGHHLGMNNRNLWLARNWASVGANAGGPRVGAVVVWRHHVGIITGRAGSQWVVKSGNDGHAVRERPRSLAGAIAFRSV